MVDNLEIHSTASSDISESLREQILGISRRKPVNKFNTKSQNTLLSHDIVNKKDSSFEVINYSDIKSAGDNKSISKESSYHTASSRGGQSVRKNSVDEKFENLSKQSNDSVLMNAKNEPRHITVETQTVGIQTVATGTDADFTCRCSWGDNVCRCPECQPHDCRYGYSEKSSKVDEDTTESSSHLGNNIDSSCQTVNIKKPKRYSCPCKCQSWSDYDSLSDELSDSDDSCTTDFLNLPYQNNEEYLKLLRELEKKLIARNKERVRRTMMEFERRSRQNQNLDKPICDYGEDNASLLQKLSTRRRKNCKMPVCCQCGKNKRVNSDILQNEKRWDEMSFTQSIAPSSDTSCGPSRNRVEKSLHKSHWQLDPRSGEWVKVSCFQQTDYSKAPPYGDCMSDNKKHLSSGKCKKGCCCHQNKH